MEERGRLSSGIQFSHKKFFFFFFVFWTVPVHLDTHRRGKWLHSSFSGFTVGSQHGTEVSFIAVDALTGVFIKRERFL